MLWLVGIARMQPVAQDSPKFWWEEIFPRNPKPHRSHRWPANSVAQQPYSLIRRLVVRQGWTPKRVQLSPPQPVGTRMIANQPRLPRPSISQAPCPPWSPNNSHHSGCWQPGHPFTAADVVVAHTRVALQLIGQGILCNHHHFISALAQQRDDMMEFLLNLPNTTALFGIPRRAQSQMGESTATSGAQQIPTDLPTAHPTFPAAAFRQQP